MQFKLVWQLISDRIKNYSQTLKGIKDLQLSTEFIEL